MRSTVAVPVDEMTREQLIKELHRLDEVIRDYQTKTDQDLRKENDRLHNDFWRTTGILTAICDTLLYYGLGDYTFEGIDTMKAKGGKGLVSDGVRKLARMTDAEKEKALERFKPAIDSLREKSDARQ
jgi:hypothetical protein